MKTHISINDPEIGIKIKQGYQLDSSSPSEVTYITIKELQNQGSVDILLRVEPVRLLSVLKQAVSEYEDSIFKAQGNNVTQTEKKWIPPNITEAVKQACEKPTLLEALTDICVWESERVVKQARENERWETCFKVCLKEVMKNYPYIA